MEPRMTLFRDPLRLIHFLVFLVILALPVSGRCGAGPAAPTTGGSFSPQPQ